MEYGVLCLVPVTIIVVFVLATKRTLEGLLLGAVVAYAIMYGKEFFSHFLEAMFQVACDREFQWVFLVCGLMGGLVKLLEVSGGALGFSKKAEHYCKSRRSVLLATWLLGIVIFVDEYLNIMILSAATKRLSDKCKVCREEIAYVIDSTGAPACVLLPFSTWAGFYAVVFFNQPAVRELGYTSAMSTYMHVVPFTFYAIFTLIITLLFCVGILPPIGKMKQVRARVESTGRVYSEKSAVFNTEKIEVNADGKLIDFLLPIVSLIGIAIWTDDLLTAVIITLVLCAFLYLPRRLMKFSEFCDLYIKGLVEIVPVLAIVFAAFIVQNACIEIGLSEYLVELTKPFLSGAVLPAVTFLIVAMLIFVTGSIWGISAVCVPIFVSLGVHLDANLILIMAAILSGGVFGSHACFYSDATVMTSECCGIDNFEHVMTQLPYVILSTLLTVASFLIAGFTLTPA